MSTAITPAPTGLLSSDTSSLFKTTPSSSSTTTSGPDLSRINDEIAEIIDQIKLTNSGQVKEFEKSTNDVRIDNNMTARDIGVLRKNNSRLNLFSALTKGDAVDVFRFRINTTSATKLGTLIADPEVKDMFRVQIFSKSTGSLLVDNDPSAGDAYARYTVLAEGRLEMKQGDYYMRISRMPGADAAMKKEIQYAVQLTQGTFVNDYDTIERGTSSSQDQFGFSTSLGAGTEGLISTLTSGYQFIANLAPIGQSATSKLQGALYDALF